MAAKKTPPARKIRHAGAAMLHVGANAMAVTEARAAINDILGSAACDAAKTAALTALSSLCAVGQTTVSGCNFTNN